MRRLSAQRLGTRDEPQEQARHAVPSVNVLGVRIMRMTLADARSCLVRLMQDDQPHSLFIVNAATANLCYEDASYRALINRGHLVLNDGTGVRWAARWQGQQLAHNFVGTDLIPLLCDDGLKWGMRVFVLGGKPGVVERASDALGRRFPGLQIVGHHHGYVGPGDDENVVREINAVRPHLLLVAMGNPIQEKWIDRNLGRLQTGLAVGVGGLIDHLAGDLRRAHPWVRVAGCEWLQILLQQPHKWKRYLLGNPLFLYRMVFGPQPDSQS